MSTEKMCGPMFEKGLASMGEAARKESETTKIQDYENHRRTLSLFPWQL